MASDVVVGKIYSIELPLPPREAGKNAHRGYRERASATSPYMAEIRARLASARNRGELPAAFTPPVWIHLDFYLFDNPSLRVLSYKTGKRVCGFYQPTDEDNARGAAWQIQDALVREGFLPDDTDRYVHVGETVCRRGGPYSLSHENRTCVVVRIEERPGLRTVDQIDTTD